MGKNFRSLTEPGNTIRFSYDKENNSSAIDLIRNDGTSKDMKSQVTLYLVNKFGSGTNPIIAADINDFTIKLCKDGTEIKTDSFDKEIGNKFKDFREERKKGLIKTGAIATGAAVLLAGAASLPDCSGMLTYGDNREPSGNTSHTELKYAQSPRPDVKNVTLAEYKKSIEKGV